MDQIQTKDTFCKIMPNANSQNIKSSKDSVSAAYFKWHQINALTDFVYHTPVEDTSGISAHLHLSVLKEREGLV